VSGIQSSVAFTVGATESATVRLAFRGRMHEGMTDYWDGNWLLTQLSGAVSGFRFDIAAALRADEIKRFRQGLQQLSERRSGQAQLSSIEEWVDLLITGDGSGPLEVTGFISGQRRHNRLQFALEINEEAFLPGLLAELAAAESRFPVLGAPSR
jgi:hypothetical protein